MKFYDYEAAVNARRVRIFAEEKGIELPSVQVDIAAGENLSDEYRRVNPAGLVPSLETDEGPVITESVAICRYLESLYPDPNLMGRNPLETAIIEGWERRMEMQGILAVAYAFRETTPVFENRATAGSSLSLPQIPALAERGRALAQDFFARLNTRLTDSEFVATDRFTIADITAFVTCGFAKWVKIDAAATGPGLERWYKAIKARPSSKA